MSADLFVVASLLPRDSAPPPYPGPAHLQQYSALTTLRVVWRKSVLNYVLQAGRLSLLSEGSSYTSVESRSLSTHPGGSTGVTAVALRKPL